jgi:putative transposase
MAGQRYRKSLASASSLQYHVVFCPKYRRPVLVGEVAEALLPLLRETAADLGVGLEAAEVLPDHVHLFITDAPPTDAPQHLVNQLKGRSSRVLRQRFPTLRSRLPSLWSRSYFIASVGHVSAATVRRYIEQQKGR